MKDRHIRDYIPVIISVIVLILLIVALVFTINYKFDEPDTSDNSSPTYTSINPQDYVVDSASCEGDVVSPDDIKKITTSYYVNTYVVGQAIDQMAPIGDDLDIDDVVDENEELNIPEEDLPLTDITGRELVIRFSNVPKGITIEVTNNLNDSDDKLSSDDAKDGILDYHIGNENSYDLANYYIKIYSNKCSEVLYRNFKLEMPMLNYYYKDNACNYVNNVYCDEVVNFYIDADEFDKNVITRFQEKRDDIYKVDEEEKNPIIRFVKDHFVISIIIIVALIIVVVIVIIFIIKKRGESHEKF